MTNGAPTVAGVGARAREVLPAALPALVLAVLGGVLVGQRRALWYDELYTLRTADAGLADLAAAVVDGTGTTAYLADVPPSYNAPFYAVAHLWHAVVPADDVGLRLLSLLPAVAAVALLARAVQRLAGRRAGFAAGLLAATSPLLVEYSAEGRMYGLAVLATTTAALGLARVLDGARHGLPLVATGALGAGLAHWFTVPVLAGFALAAVALRRRAGLPVAAAAALGAVAPAALLALAVANGTGTSVVGLVREIDSPVPVEALQAWAGGSTALLVALLAATVAGLRWQRGAATVVAAAWLGVPLLAVWVLHEVRPAFVPRYLLPALLGVAVLAGLGVSVGRLWLPLTGALAALSVVASLPLYAEGPREDTRGAVEALEAVYVPGQPVVAADRRAALALDHYAGPDVRASLRLPPQDPPPGADVVWVLRQASGERVFASDDDELLARDGLRLTSSRVFRGTSSDLVLQRWER